MMNTQTAIQPEMPITEHPLPLMKFSVEQYHEMINAGIFTENNAIELLDGWIIHKMPKNPPHSFSNQILLQLLLKIIPANWFAIAQEPVTLAKSEPEPDIVVVVGDRRDFLDRHPQPADIPLVIEVSDATLRHDRTVKRTIYAQASIPAYWIVNLQESKLEVYSELSLINGQLDYTSRRDYGRDDSVAVVLRGQEVGVLAVGEFLP
jgi:Uma2 family endonuclease